MRADDQPEWVQERRRILGRRIRDARMRANLPQERLAEAIGADRRTMQKWESGRADIPVGRLWMIAARLGVHATDLLS